MWGFGLRRVCNFDFSSKNIKGVNINRSRPLFVGTRKKNICLLYDKKMVAPGGIEPPTQGFSVLCSTN